MPTPVQQRTIDPGTLRRVGIALYGERWKLALARDLGISERMVRFMLAGERGIRPIYAVRMLDILRVRQAELDDIRVIIRRLVRQPVEHV